MTREASSFKARTRSRWLWIALIALSPCTLFSAASTAGGAKGIYTRCAALNTIDLAQLQDAPTKVTRARYFSPNPADGPPFCEVEGHVEPRMRFLLRLPGEGWNGKLIELGCGAFCGSTEHIVRCEEPLRHGYACVVSDGGHRAHIADAAWARGNLKLLIDYFVTSSHVTALASKSIVEAYYGILPRKSYFMGCSSGGEQALMEAQRFPWDFDGIIAGQPTSEMQVDLSGLWGNRVIMGGGHTPLLNAQDLGLLHRAVLNQCDLNDGIKDGLIGDPGACGFEPSALLCTGSAKSGCLTFAQVEAVKKLYAGPTNSRGESVGLPGAFKGSELTWLDIYAGSADEPRGTYRYAGEPFRSFGFQPVPPTTWQAAEFDFDRDYKRLGIAEGLISPVNPDLRQFKAAGGKLLAYAGWSDALGLPASSIDYYETAEKTLGGRAATQGFFRLFMVPGMNHCVLGPGAYAVDYLSYLDAWVERGEAPDRLLAVHPKTPDGPQDTATAMRRLRFPIATSSIEFTRPLYPYPAIAKYLGLGNPNDATSFGPSPP